MKTIDEFIKEIDDSKAIQEELKAVKNKDALAELFKKYDVDGTVDDFGKAVKAKAKTEGELSDKDTEAVAGGAFPWNILFQ